MIAWIFLIFINWAHAALEPEDLPHIEYNRDPYLVSEGYRLGLILDFARAGIFPWSYEGTMMVGFGTGRQDFIDQHCVDDILSVVSGVSDPSVKQKYIDEANEKCYIFTNPWPFSTLDSIRLREFQNTLSTRPTPVMIHYEVPYLSVERVITRTKHFVEGIYPVNPNANVPKSYSIPESSYPVSHILNIRRGVIEGRIVKASLDHFFRKSFEVIIQEGNLGNNFRRMSVSDQGMFDFIIAAMLTGKMTRISYIELLGLENDIIQIAKDYDTPYRVVSVEVQE